jgi:hypothetical protein
MSVHGGISEKMTLYSGINLILDPQNIKTFMVV